ncbi:MAG: ABC transporter substrate-binding protein [Pseudaminobacter sp.]
MNSQLDTRKRKSLRVIAGIGMLATTFMCAPAALAQDTSFKTIEPGTLTIAIASYMPYSGVIDGKLTGLDGDLVTAVAEKLGLKVKTNVSDFAGILAAVQTNRADIAVGSIGWTEARAKAGIFTDSPYYSNQVVLVREDQNVTKIEDLEGLTVATGIGYSYIPAIQAIPNTKLKTYPTPANMLEDLVAKRVDAVFTDALVNIAYAKEKPGVLKAAPMTPPTEEQLAEHPDYKYLFPRPGGFYLNAGNTALENAVTEAIRGLYKDGTTESLLVKWGVNNPDSWTTPNANVRDRVGVDRPEDWVPASK